jgi:uncharacterized protein (TIGR02246 family)
MLRAIRGSSLAAGLVWAVVALAGYAHAAAPAADEAGIRAQTTSWAKAYNGGDAKAVAALYAEDAILLPPGAPAAKGRAAIVEFFTKDIAGSKAAGAVIVVNPKTDVGVSGNMGWESGTYTVTVKGATRIGKVSFGPRARATAMAHLRDTWNADAAPAPRPPRRRHPAAPAKK